jgi:hypothetical protein
MSLGRRTAIDIVDGSHDYDSRNSRIISAQAYIDSMLEHLAELVFAAGMKGATPNQLKETVLAQLAMPELRIKNARRATQPTPPPDPAPSRYETTCCWAVDDAGTECVLPLGHDGKCSAVPPEPLKEGSEP